MHAPKTLDELREDLRSVEIKIDRLNAAGGAEKIENVLALLGLDCVYWSLRMRIASTESRHKDEVEAHRQLLDATRRREQISLRQHDELLPLILEKFKEREREGDDLESLRKRVMERERKSN